MRAYALALASFAAACSPTSVNGLYNDAATADTPAVTADVPATATDVPVAAVDVPVTTPDVPTTTTPDVPTTTTPDVPTTTTHDVPTTAVDAGFPMDVPSTTTGDAGTILPPRDAGPLPFDTGALGDPAWVPLDVRVNGTCTPLSPCGGDVVGTWDVGGGCIEFPVPSELMACPGAMVTRADGRARGRVVYTASFARRASQWETEAEVYIPAVCATFIGGCPAIQNLIRGTFPDSSCATEAGGACRCGARQSGSFDGADAYTTSSTQIISSTTNKRWNYCIAGTQLRYQDVSSSGAREPGIIELTRRAP